MNRSAPMVQITYGDFTLTETGDSTGYADLETDQGTIRVHAEKPSTFKKLKKALARHPLPDVVAYASTEGGVTVLRYADSRIRKPDARCSCAVKGQYLGTSNDPSYLGHFVARVGYRNKSARTGRTFEGEIPVHLPERLRDKLPAEGELIKVVGWPVPTGATTRVTDTGQTEELPDLLLLGSALHDGRRWIHRDAVMSMVPSTGLHYCAKCDGYLPREDFYPKSKLQERPRKPCIECSLKRQREYDAGHREESRARHRANSAKPEVRERVNAKRRQKGRRDAYRDAGFPGLGMGEHRWVVIQHRGHLTDVEVVHHKDHDPLNNAIDNLWVFATQGEHKAYERGRDVQPVWRGDRCECSQCADHANDEAA